MFFLRTMQQKGHAVLWNKRENHSFTKPLPLTSQLRMQTESRTDYNIPNIFYSMIVNEKRLE